MQIEGKQRGERLMPLERVKVSGAGNDAVSIRDSRGREYARLSGGANEFTVGGALGYHTLRREDAAGKTLETLTFPVKAETKIADADGQFAELLQMLHYTMISEFGETSSIRWNGRIYPFFICWLRDHVHVMKGMKYFSDKLTDAIDLYRLSQRDDGMIWDNVYPRTPEPNHWDMRFAEGNFIRPFDDYSGEFRRIPVENDVEFLFLEGIYFTWKAVGDDGWMALALDPAIRALEYSITSPYRWSEKFGLLKRGHTIDTWDFQDEEDSVVGGDHMRIDPETTHFGVMFGDNTGYIAACRYLAEMLEHLGRGGEAETYKKRAQEMTERLNRVSWNGNFFTHHVREDADWNPDLGVDETMQVSLSNAYSLNRGLTHDQCRAIIQTYQEIKAYLPEGSPGEWYTIYPPFPKGYGGDNGLWQYMNAGVTPIVAGELAHGAFQHGFETYGVDILTRLIALGKRYGGTFHSAYTGAMPTPPPRQWTTVDLATFANIDFSGTGGPGVPGWTDEGDNDLHEMPVGTQTFLNVPFQIADPETNGRRGGIGLRRKSGYADAVKIPIRQTAKSLYFLHTVSETGPAGVGGSITLHYDDGSSFSTYVVRGRNVQGWWQPTAPDASGTRVVDVAWRGKNALSNSVGVMAYGLDNPHPDKTIAYVTLTASDDGAFWAVLGLTLSDQAAYFSVNPISFGIPNGWSAAAVVYALVEGLAGVVDSGTAYNEVSLSPRWAAAVVPSAAVVIHYPASNGYVAYRYAHDTAAKTLTLELTGSGELCACHLLLPPGSTKVVAVSVNRTPIAFSASDMEQSRYADFSVPLPGPQTVLVQYA